MYCERNVLKVLKVVNGSTLLIAGVVSFEFEKKFLHLENVENIENLRP